MPTQRPRWWGGPLGTEQLARTAVHRVRDAAARVAAVRGLTVDVGTTDPLIAASFAAINHLRIDGRAPSAWAELSGFLRARDGWVRLHGNYPHHAAALQELYGIRDRAGLDRVLAARSAAQIEEEVVSAGGIAVAVRTEQEWRVHPQHLATAGEPWSTIVDRGARPALSAPGGASPAGAAPTGLPRPGPGRGPLPLHGLRVLDLTRVIAGPTCTQLLACLGADVLRIDPPHRPEQLDQHLSTGMGKRSALLDLRTDGGRAQAQSLAATADVILTGYRPGTLDQHGLGAEQLERLAPQAVIGLLSAWGEDGPWGSRPGFDSIVQAATGIAAVCGSEGRPGALPVQALDHATGHRIAGHVLEALAAGRAVTVRASLLGAARTLLAAAPPVSEKVVAPSMEVEGTSRGVGWPTTEVDGPPMDVMGPAVPRVLVVARGAEHVLEAVPPPLLLDGRTIEQDVPRYGAAEPVWSRSAAG